jgi:hypothetical protein
MSFSTLRSRGVSPTSITELSKNGRSLCGAFPLSKEKSASIAAAIA